MPSTIVQIIRCVVPRHLTLFSGLLGALFGALLSGAPVSAQEAGMQSYTVRAATTEQADIPVALFYPTSAIARRVPMGPFTLQVALGAAPQPRFKALIVLSHGTGGSEIGHAQLAQALASSGYLVAAPRHPGDNWQDRSLLTQSRGDRYFVERPRHLSRVIDALLADPRWAAAIVADQQGPRVAAIGHSAGGYSVLALAGGQPDIQRLSKHCMTQSSRDPVFCGVGQSRDPAVRQDERQALAALPRQRPLPVLRDGRVRAVVALSPVGVLFDPASLAAVKVATAIHVAELDRFLVPKFHGDWVAGHIPGARLTRVSGAGHFAFMDTPSMPIPSEDGDIGADPAGFERSAYLRQLSATLVRFFDDRL